MRDRYSITVGLIFLLIVAIAFLHQIGGGNQGTLGLDKLPPRWALPEFAVPLASSSLEGDANIAQDDCESSEVPCPAGAERRPACRIPEKNAIRVCELFDRPLVLSFWFTKGGGGCANRQDVVEEAFRRYRGRVNFLSVDTRDDRDTVRELVRHHGWTMPVGYDRDGAVASLYGVGGCPTLAFAYPGGTLQGTSIGEFTVAQLDTHIAELLRSTATAERG